MGGSSVPLPASNEVTFSLFQKYQMTGFYVLDIHLTIWENLLYVISALLEFRLVRKSALISCFIFHYLFKKLWIFIKLNKN